jgi:hypothetical protein
LENAERPERTFKRDGKKAGNKTRMEQSTDPYTSKKELTYIIWEVILAKLD